jgi:hypothetical protein
MEFMSAGKPAIAPAHTGMSDYLTPENAFLLGFSGEPTFWPHDPRRALRAMRQRIDAASLDRAFAESFAAARGAPEKYFAMALAATNSLAKHCAMTVVETKLRRVIADTLEAAAHRATQPAEQPALDHADAAAD